MKKEIVSISIGILFGIIILIIGFFGLVIYNSIPGWVSQNHSIKLTKEEKKKLKEQKLKIQFLDNIESEKTLKEKWPEFINYIKTNTYEYRVRQLDDNRLMIYLQVNKGTNIFYEFPLYLHKEEERNIFIQEIKALNMVVEAIKQSINYNEYTVMADVCANKELDEFIIFVRNFSNSNLVNKYKNKEEFYNVSFKTGEVVETECPT